MLLAVPVVREQPWLLRVCNLLAAGLYGRPGSRCCRHTKTSGPHVWSPRYDKFGWELNIIVVHKHEITYNTRGLGKYEDQGMTSSGRIKLSGGGGVEEMAEKVATMVWLKRLLSYRGGVVWLAKERC